MKPDSGDKIWDQICFRRFGRACTNAGAAERKHTHNKRTANQILHAASHLCHISLWRKRQTKIKPTVNQQPVRETKRTACMCEHTGNASALKPERRAHKPHHYRTQRWSKIAPIHRFLTLWTAEIQLTAHVFKKNPIIKSIISVKLKKMCSLEPHSLNKIVFPLTHVSNLA